MSLDGGFDKIVTVARNAFNSGKTRPITFRRTQLRKFLQMLEESQQEMQQAINLDLRKHKLEVTLYEIEGLMHEAKTLMSNLIKLAEPEHLPFNMLAALDSGKIEKCPYGVVLVLGAWNYPFLLTLQPVLGAIAAGNCVIIKPSEVSPNTAALMAKLLPKYLDPECYHVIQAGPEETQHLLTFKFDYIFYTGSTHVGRLVMQAAAQHLTPVTLELGGKSPVYLDENSDYEIATKRILWGRLANCGQTCIAPDYLLCSKKVESEVIRIARGVIKEWYGEDPQKSESFPRIVNEKHCLRLKNLIDTTRGKILIGGKVDVEDRYVEPTLVVDVMGDDPLLQEEIFGPILPIVTVNGVNEAIEFINARPRPLALYSFSKNSAVNKEMKDKTISGGVCLNDTMWHCVWNGLPFGGVGDSGMGNYHGKYTFDTFSHHRSILDRGFSGISEKLGEARYPPYNDTKISMFTFIIRHFMKFNVRAMPFITHLIAAFVGAAILACFVYSK